MKFGDHFIHVFFQSDLVEKVFYLTFSFLKDFNGISVKFVEKELSSSLFLNLPLMFGGFLWFLGFFKNYYYFFPDKFFITLALHNLGNSF